MIGAPDWRRIGEAFSFEWPGHRLVLSGIRESSGDIRGELEASYAEGEGWTALAAPMLLNLRSPRGKGDVTRVLVNRDDSFPWADALEAVAIIGLREWRRGGPIVPLHTVPAPDRLRYLIDRILPENETTIVFGDGESGKSLFAMFCAVCVATGYPLPRGLGADHSGNVLYLDFESDAAEHARRLKRIANGLGIDVPANIFYRECHRPIADDAAMLAREVAEREVALTVVDSLAPACGDDPSAPGVAIATMNALRSLGGTRMAIGHVNRTDRERPNANQTTFGSIFWRNAARAMWQLTPNQDAPAGTAPFALHNRKNNNDAREKWPIGLQYVFGADSIGIEPYDVRANDVLAEGATTAARIRDALKRGSLDTGELADAVGMEANTVRTACQRMADVIQLEPATPGRGGKPAVWGLVAQGVQR